MLEAKKVACCRALTNIVASSNSSNDKRNVCFYLLPSLTILIVSAAPLHAQNTEDSPEPVTQISPSLTVDSEKSSDEIIAQLNSPNLTPEKRAEIIATLDTQREALFSEYIAEYRKAVRESHKLHPEDPWLAAEKIQKALEAKTPLIERHDDLANILDEHAPVMRPNTDEQLRTHLAKLPAANRQFIEATKAALLLDNPSESFEALAAAQARLAVEMAKDPAADSSPLRDTPERQAYLRLLHQSLIETDPENTPPLAEFLDSQSISRLSNQANPNPVKP